MCEKSAFEPKAVTQRAFAGRGLGCEHMEEPGHCDPPTHPRGLGTLPTPHSLFPRDLPHQLGLRAVHLELPPPGDLGQGLVLLDLLLLLDLVRQELRKGFVSWGGKKMGSGKGRDEGVGGEFRERGVGKRG